LSGDTIFQRVFSRFYNRISEINFTWHCTFVGCIWWWYSWLSTKLCMFMQSQVFMVEYTMNPFVGTKATKISQHNKIAQ